MNTNITETHSSSPKLDALLAQGKNVLCYVSDNEYFDNTVAIITEKTQHDYKDASGAHWVHVQLVENTIEFVTG